MTAAVLLMTCLLGTTPWRAQTLTGQVVEVPAAQPTVLLFLRPGQKQSAEALAELRLLVGTSTDLQLLAVVSGTDAPMRAQQAVKEMKIDWPMVADTDFAAAGAFDVHVWPTTVAVGTDGKVVAHIASTPSSYRKDLQAYLDRLRGRIDDAALQQRLNQTGIVADSPQQMAARHLKVAQQMAPRHGDLAKAELAKAIALEPTDPALQLAIADLLSQLGEAAQALTVLDKIPADAAPPWRPALIRGRCLLLQKQTTQAAEQLTLATRLNPRPAEAWYLLGRIAQDAGQMDQAAQAYRKAYETTEAGRR